MKDYTIHMSPSSFIVYCPVRLEKDPEENSEGTPRNPCIDIVTRRGKNIDSFGK